MPIAGTQRPLESSGGLFASEDWQERLRRILEALAENPFNLTSRIVKSLTEPDVTEFASDIAGCPWLTLLNAHRIHKQYRENGHFSSQAEVQ